MRLETNNVELAGLGLSVGGGIPGIPGSSPLAPPLPNLAAAKGPPSAPGPLKSPGRHDER